MTQPPPTAVDHLEQARELVWETVHLLEEAQRTLFRAGDCYVAELWGDGVRDVIHTTESMAEMAGDLSTIHIRIGQMIRRDRDHPREERP